MQIFRLCLIEFVTRNSQSTYLPLYVLRKIEENNVEGSVHMTYKHTSAKGWWYDYSSFLVGFSILFMVIVLNILYILARSLSLLVFLSSFKVGISLFANIIYSYAFSFFTPYVLDASFSLPCSVIMQSAHCSFLKHQWDSENLLLRLVRVYTRNVCYNIKRVKGK